MKPRLIVYSTNRDLTSKITLEFAQGASVDTNWEVKYENIDRWVSKGFEKDFRPGIDAVASLGILRGTGEMFGAAAAAGIDYYYMDHAYYSPGYGGPGWMRIVKNGHSINRLGKKNSNRYLKYFKNLYPIHDWKTHAQRGNKILVCPPTDAVSWYMGLTENWENTIVDKLKTILPLTEHRNIIVRRKPNEPTVDNRGNLLGFKQNTTNGSFEEDLKSANCVIAYNSMVSLTATLHGIPVIVSKHSCCAPISFSVDDLKNQHAMDVEPINRKQLVHWLAENQWNREEIRNGTAWQHLQEINKDV